MDGRGAVATRGAPSGSFLPAAWREPEVYPRETAARCRGNPQSNEIRNLRQPQRRRSGRHSRHQPRRERRGKPAFASISGASPLYRSDPIELAALATEIAARAVESSPVPLESVAVTFYENAVSGGPEKLDPESVEFLPAERWPSRAPLVSASPLLSSLQPKLLSFATRAPAADTIRWAVADLAVLCRLT